MENLAEKSASSLRESRVSHESRDRVVVNGSIASSSGVHPVISVQPRPGETTSTDNVTSKSKSSLKNSKSG